MNKSKGVFYKYVYDSTHNIDPKDRVVFAAKYLGRSVLRRTFSLRERYRWKGKGTIEAESCPDHIRMLPEIPFKYSVSLIKGCFKVKSSLLIYEWQRNAKFRYSNRKMLCRYHREVCSKIVEYVRNRLKETLSKVS